MKKLITCALCFAFIGGVSAQTQVLNQAKKLVGKKDKIEEARSLIKEALNNPETAQNPETYYVAGNIEFGVYDLGNTLKATTPDDPLANPITMGEALINGYNYYMQALPLDSLPNEKGQIKPKYSKDIVSKLASHSNDFFNSGAAFFNEKKYYPEAYEAFEIYGDLSQSPLMEKNQASFNPELIANSFFNAGLSAYSGNAVDQSAAAFKKAMLAGYDQPECYIYELACWQNIAQSDESREKEAQANILETAKAGFEKFGLEQPVFLNNIVNSYVINGDTNAALGILNPVIEQNPEVANLYGLRGFIYDRAGNDEASEADYRKAASLPDADVETLKNVSKKLFLIGTNKLNALEGNSAENQSARQKIKTNYFEAARAAAEKASNINPNDTSVEDLLESIEYSLTTYF